MQKFTTILNLSNSSERSFESCWVSEADSVVGEIQPRRLLPAIDKYLWDECR